ncbi:hypothetical protein LG198_04975 [Methylobacillus arboreus]|uniref:hypothetical protein n=1 Tax=Methylobacillus arboreus TaxID=755170 RepID=UPI001E2D69C0|nr:hypothetical protein [Methylobacillus arboreus]MCB5190075.1 hypothetical protein [Methylobacillus arboreus]
MSLDENAIHSINEYFPSIAQIALDHTYEVVTEDTTFAEFMESLIDRINQYSAEHVATEVLGLSSRKIETINDSTGITVDDVQDFIDNAGDDEEDYEA